MKTLEERRFGNSITMQGSTWIAIQEFVSKHEEYKDISHAIEQAVVEFIQKENKLDTQCKEAKEILNSIKCKR